MTVFNDYKVALEFAEIRAEESMEDMLIMKKDNEYMVTGSYNYREAKDLGYELETSIYLNY